MDDSPTTRQYLVSGFLLMLVGWGGLALLLFVFNVPPLVWARWGFFALWLIALTGTALPITYYLNVRFPSEPAVEPHGIVRQAIWVGVYGATVAWLQLGQLATLWVWIGLGGGLVAIEYLIRSRERSHWRPPVDTDDFRSLKGSSREARDSYPAEADEHPE